VSLKKEYQRLPGRRYLSFGVSRSSLWLGKDHLLQVINRGYTEEYRRYQYTDIQAIIFRETPTWQRLNAILGGISFVCLLILALGFTVWRWDEFGLIPMATATFFWLLLFVIHLAAGRTCVCHLRTAVRFEPLPSLFRMRNAFKAIALMQRRIESVQGTLAPPETTIEEQHGS